MTELRTIPLTADEKRMGLLRHVGLGATAKREDGCKVCGAKLHHANRSGFCMIHGPKTGFALAKGDPDERRTFHDVIQRARRDEDGNIIPSTVEATRIKRVQIRCAHCGRDQFKLTSPACWPITVVAVTCATCGTVAGYYDEQVSRDLLSVTPGHDMPPRESMISHRTYKPVRSDDETRAQVIEGLKLGVEPDQVAEDLEVTPEYVHSVGVNEGLMRARRAEWHKDLARLAAEGKGAKEIAAELRQSPAAVRMAARKKGIRFAPKLTQLDRIRVMAKAGMRTTDIARELGINSCVVSHARNLKSTAYERALVN